MKILLIGQGGREHAIAWKLTSSPKVTNIFVAPGNAGTERLAKTNNINLAVNKNNNFDNIIKFCQQNNIDLVIIGPEIPLANGLVDDLQKNDILAFGPTKAAAQLESSKIFCKNLCYKNNIKTSKFTSFNNYHSAHNFIIQRTKFPIVIKENGLAAGKGVTIVNSKIQAITVINNIFAKTSNNKFNQIIIEDFLTGSELSYFALVINNKIISLTSAQDYKTRFINNQGPNTGGMGAISPAPIITDDLETKILNNILIPTMSGLADLNINYTGFLYAGLIVDHDNNPWLLEYNCRLGDPEAQVILPRLTSDLAEICYQAAQGNYHNISIKFNTNYALTTVLVNKNYPAACANQDIILGLNNINLNETQYVFHAGTKYNLNNQLITNGGRVLCVTTQDKSLAQAKLINNNVIKAISWRSMDYRRDIGKIADIKLASV